MYEPYIPILFDLISLIKTPKELKLLLCRGNTSPDEHVEHETHSKLVKERSDPFLLYKLKLVVPTRKPDWESTVIKDVGPSSQFHRDPLMLAGPATACRKAGDICGLHDSTMTIHLFIKDQNWIDLS